LYGLRGWIEQSYKQLKNELGWADAMVRVNNHPKVTPIYQLKFPPSGLMGVLNDTRIKTCFSIARLRLMSEGRARGRAPSPLRVRLQPRPGLNAGGALSSLGLSSPALSFSLSLKLSPLILTVIE